MSAAYVVAHVAVLLLLPVLLTGMINRTKAFWGGRKGPPLLQTFYDLVRLARKRPVYSTTTTAMFRMGPLVVLATTLITALFIPLLGTGAPLAFQYDFIAVAYLWGLGRVFIMLAALDTGSAFEAMGASREATFGALAEPVLILILGALACATGNRSFSDMFHVGFSNSEYTIVTICCAIAAFIILQVESARSPVDDPNTHLELTMIHEVMILDHSGPELAALQYAAAVKITIGAGLLATLLNPLIGIADPVLSAAVNVGLVLAVGILVGCVESLIARFQMKAIAHYILVGLIAASVALLSVVWQQGGI
jgi:formate hydrogenlyase subunit 4